MNNKILFLTVFLLSNILFAQKNSININAGISSEGEFANGEYFSCDFRIPIFKSVFISPTFTYSNSLPNYTNGILLTEDDISLMYSNGNLNEKFIGRKFGSLDLLILFKPFDLLKKEIIKHEIVIGSGFGYKSNIKVRAYYDVSNSPDLKLLDYKSGSSLGLYMFKFDYNYLIKENIYIGFTTSSNIIDGDAGVILTGIQLGVKF